MHLCAYIMFTIDNTKDRAVYEKNMETMPPKLLFASKFRFRFFLQEIQAGEALISSGDIEQGVTHLANAVVVCGQPTQLLQVSDVAHSMPTVYYNGQWAWSHWFGCNAQVRRESYNVLNVSRFA